MGYETRLIVGQVHKGVKDENTMYFLKMAEVDLGKCGSEGAMSDLIDKALGEKNVLNLQEVYYCRGFSINREKVTEDVKEKIVKLSPISEEEIMGIANKVMDISESWEDMVKEDSYGEPLRAVPIELVIKAMSKAVKEDTPPYRRFEMALPLLKVIKKRFTEGTVFCILFGY